MGDLVVAGQNPLLSAQKSSDSGLQVALHPLVLLTISDYITRHTLRNQKGPVVGALLGQQIGREITIEHAFDCLLLKTEDAVILSPGWFESRLQQMRDVHKSPALDLVGWYTIIPTSGPQPAHLPIHRQILHQYNESAILLGFHPTEVVNGSDGGKLPLTIYESNYEAEGSTGETGGEDKEMSDAEPQLNLKFKELPYSVETGEAEMISVDFVARGGGNATAVGTDSKKAASLKEDKGKGKAPSKSEDSTGSSTEDRNVLSREDEEQLASLVAKANAIKMLHSRINLIAAYLQKLPPSYISDGVTSEADTESKKYAQVNQSILRSIQALLSRLSVLVPADSLSFEQELMSEKNDVGLISLLSEITKSVQEVRETGKKFAIVEHGKATKMKRGDGASWTDDSHPMRQIMNVGDLMG